MDEHYTPTQALLETLQGLAHSLQTISDEDYAHTKSKVFQSSIGAHVRHSLDHIGILLTAVLDAPKPQKAAGGNNSPIDQESPVVYYDRRIRGTDLERSRRMAIHTIEKMIEDLQSIPNSRLPEKIHIEHMLNGNGDTYIFESNLAREFFFTAHHAIHHNAIIAACLRELGYKTPEHFGVAPSTIEYESTSQNS